MTPVARALNLAQRTRAAPFVEHAYRYGALGWALIRVDGKKAVGKRWQETCPDATPELAAGKWADWGTRWNMGVVHGPSGTVCAEADSEDGRKKLLELFGGRLPETPVFQAHRGAHCHFRDPGGLTSAKRDGIELRVGGHMCCLPPSIHPDTGESYRWLSEPETPLAEVPHAVIDYLSAASSRTGPAPAIVAEIPQGERNATLTRLAGIMRRPGMGKEEILAALRVTNAERCTPPLADSELERIAHSVSRYPPAPQMRPTGDAAGTHPAFARAEGNRRRRPRSDDAREALAETAPTGGWSAPAPLSAEHVPPFPLAALPSPLRHYVEELATETQTPPDLAAMLSLVICGACGAKRCEVHVQRGWSEPLNVFTVTALPPGNRKSAVFRAAERPLVHREREEAKQVGPAMEEAKVRRRVIEERQRAAEKEAAKADDDAREGLLGAVNRIMRELDDLPVPTPPRYVVDDVTPERLAGLLAENGGRMATLSAEGEVFELLAGRYSGNVPNIGVYLQGHAGDTLRVDRIGREPVFVASPALTVGLTVQPHVIAGLARKPGFRGRGLLARFLYAMPVSLVGRRDIDPPEMSAAAEQDYAALIARLLNIPASRDDLGEPAPNPMTLTAEAHETLRDFRAWREPLLGEHEELGAIADWASKLEGVVVRLSGILHLVQHAESFAPWEEPISAATVASAIEIAHYLVAHARAAFALMGADPAVEDAKYILSLAQRHGLRQLSKRDLHALTKGRFKRVADLEPGLGVLFEHGYAREQPQRATGRPGRPRSPVVEFHPGLPQ